MKIWGVGASQPRDMRSEATSPFVTSERQVVGCWRFFFWRSSNKARSRLQLYKKKEKLGGGTRLALGVVASDFSTSSSVLVNFMYQCIANLRWVRINVWTITLISSNDASIDFIYKLYSLLSLGRRGLKDGNVPIAQWVMSQPPLGSVRLNVRRHGIKHNRMFSYPDSMEWAGE